MVKVGMSGARQVLARMQIRALSLAKTRLSEMQRESSGPQGEWRV